MSTMVPCARPNDVTAVFSGEIEPSGATVTTWHSADGRAYLQVQSRSGEEKWLQLVSTGTEPATDPDSAHQFALTGIG